MHKLSVLGEDLLSQIFSVVRVSDVYEGVEMVDEVFGHLRNRRRWPGDAGGEHGWNRILEYWVMLQKLLASDFGRRICAENKDEGVERATCTICYVRRPVGAIYAS